MDIGQQLSAAEAHDALDLRLRMICGHNSEKEKLRENHPKDPAVLKILRVVNLLRVVFLVRRGDLLSRRSLCRPDFPGNYRHFTSSRRVHGVVNLGGVAKTLRRSNSLFLLSS